MDARIERLLRRDKDGVPLPLTPEEISNFSRKFGPQTAQQATQEVLSQRKQADERASTAQEKARTQRQEDEDRAARQEEQRLAREQAAGKAKADLEAQQAETRRKADEAAAKAAREGAETEKLKKAQERQDELNKIMATYRDSYPGMAMTGLNALSPAAGILGGYGVAEKLIEPRISAAESVKNLQRAALGAAFDRVDSNSSTASAEYKSINDAARKGNLIPEEGKTGTGKRYLPYGISGAAMLAEGALQRYLGSDPDKSPFTQDAWTASGTGNMGAGATLLYAGSKYAPNPALIPNAEALRKIDLAKQYADKFPVTGDKVTPPTAPERPQVPVREPYKGDNAQVLRHMASDLGYDHAARVKKPDLIKGLINHIDSGTPSDLQLRTAAAGVKGLDAGAPAEDLTKSLKDFVRGRAPRDRVASILATLGIGTGILGLTHGSEPAEAGRRRDEDLYDYRLRQALNTARGVGTEAFHLSPLGAAWDTGTLAGDLTKAATAPRSAVLAPEQYTPPDYGDPRSSKYNPAKIREEQSKRRGLEQALAEDARQKRNPNPYPAPHEEIGAGARNAVPSVAGPGFDRSVGRGRAGTEAQPSAFLNAKDYGITPSASPEDRALQTLYKAADDDTSGLAQGGEVHKGSLHGLSTVQTSLDTELKQKSKKIDTLEKAKDSEAVKRALAKAHADREDCVHDIWAVHHLAKDANEGHVTLKPGMTKQAILALARSRYDRETGQPHHRQR